MMRVLQELGRNRFTGRAASAILLSLPLMMMSGFTASPAFPSPDPDTYRRFASSEIVPAVSLVEVFSH